MKKIFILALLLFAVKVSAAPSFSYKGGRTSVTLSSEFVSALETLEIGLGRIKPTRIKSGVARFPANFSEVDLEDSSAEIFHTGGLTLSSDTTVVELSNFIIDTDEGVLTGLVKVDNSIVDRIPLFNVTLSPDVTTPLPESARLAVPATLTLTETAATTLNATFAVEAFAADLSVGSSTSTLIRGRD